MPGIKHKTLTSELAPGGKLGAAEWDDTHVIETLDMVGLTADPDTPADGQAWYRSDLGLHRIYSGGRVIDLAPMGYEAALAGDITLTAADNGKTLTLTASRIITLPTAPVIGYAVGVSCNSSSTATLVPGAATVDRGNFVYPGEWALLVWSGATWRRVFRRGGGINNAGAMGLLSDLRSTVHPSGLWIATTATANIDLRPSCLDNSCIVRIERCDASNLSLTMWSLNQAQGSWRATYAAGVWSAWANGGTIAALTTAQLPTNVAMGAEVFDTTRDRMVVWDGAVWVDASDRANHTGTQLAATISDFAAAADARVAPALAQMLPVVPATSGTWAHLGEGRGTLGARAETANIMRMRPYIARATGSITSVAVSCSTAVASSLAKVAIYEDAGGRPSNLIAESADMDCSTTGVKTAPISSVPQIAGRQYWAAVRVNSNQGLNTDPGSPRIDGAASALFGAPSAINRTVTYASAAPATWIWSASEILQNRDPWAVMGGYA